MFDWRNQLLTIEQLLRGHIFKSIGFGIMNQVKSNEQNTFVLYEYMRKT